MSRFRIDSLARLLRGDYAAEADDVALADGDATPKRFAIGGVVLALAIAAGVMLSDANWLECALLAVVAILALTIALLLKRHQWYHEALAAERRQLRTAVDNIPQGLVLYDASATIVVCNRPYVEMFGLSPDVAKQGCTMQRLIEHRKETGSFDGDVEAFCAAIIHNVRLGQGTRQLTEAPGGRAIEIVNKPLKSGGWVATIEDITARKRAEEKIAHLAHYDALTDLPNRALFREKLEVALKELGPGEQLAVLYIDIDEFKSINDALGHPVGDELLKEVAERLRGCIGEADVAARLGGDEFAIIQNCTGGRAETERLVEALYAAIRQPLECAGHLISTDASIGIAMAPGDGVHLDQLLKNADLALYGAKGDGRRTYRFFEQDMGARARARRTLELELRQAIGEGGFEVHYQPLVDLRDDRISGCEALLRWRHPQRGNISPAEFIPVAEESGLIVEIGKWVLERACMDAVALYRQTGTWLSMAVNVSARQLRDKDFIGIVERTLLATGMPPERLELELTESMLMEDMDGAIDFMHKVRALGVRLSIDDFGTGYSSLAYLQTFPINHLKIDRSFVRLLPTSGTTIAGAVIALAHGFNLTVVAEGVEEPEQFDWLRQAGCDYVQGYLFARPLPLAALRARMLDERAPVA